MDNLESQKIMKIATDYFSKEVGGGKQKANQMLASLATIKSRV